MILSVSVLVMFGRVTVGSVLCYAHCVVPDYFFSCDVVTDENLPLLSNLTSDFWFIS